MPRVIKVAFSDFWPGFERDNYFLRFLKRHYKVEVSDQPDYLFYSVYGTRHLQYGACIKIFYTGENVVPDFNECDYALGFHRLTLADRYLRFPLYVIYPGYDMLRHKQLSDISQLLNRKFCNFIYSNSNYCNPAREEFYKKLSVYKRVDSGGRLLNNLGGPIIDKRAFIADYKFTIAFENSSVPGYTTEKIMDPMVVNSVPVYWGNPDIALDFNLQSFVNVMDFPSMDAAVQEVIRLDKNDDEYLKLLTQPWLTSRHSTRYEEELRQFLDVIFQQELMEAKRAPEWGFAAYLRQQKTDMAELWEQKQNSNRRKHNLLKWLRR